MGRSVTTARYPRRRERVGLIALVGGAVLLAGMLTSCSSAASSSAPSITLYNGQHLQTTDALVAAFEKQTGIQVDGSQRRRRCAGQPAHPGGVPLAGRRILHRELAGADDTGRTGDVGQGRSIHPHPRALAIQLAQRRLGRGDRPGQCPGLQHEPARARSGTHVDPGAGPAPMEGQDRHRPVGDRLPTHRHVRAADLRQAATLRGSKGYGRMPARCSYPDNETLVDMVSRRSNSIDLCALNQYYWYRERDHGRCGQYALGHRLPRPEDPGYVARRVRCRHPGHRATTRRRPRSFWPSS